MVQAELRCKPRYLHPAVHRGGAGGASTAMRAARSEARRQRALSTVRFMIRRVHDCVRGRQYRDVENVSPARNKAGSTGVHQQRRICAVLKGRR